MGKMWDVAYYFIFWYYSFRLIIKIKWDKQNELDLLLNLYLLITMQNASSDTMKAQISSQIVQFDFKIEINPN